jgi:hypothetical protein
VDLGNSNNQTESQYAHLFNATFANPDLSYPATYAVDRCL